MFGSAFIASVILTPLCGKYLSAGGGAFRFLVGGSLMSGTGNILFGFLGSVDDDR